MNCTVHGCIAPVLRRNRAMQVMDEHVLSKGHKMPQNIAAKIGNVCASHFVNELRLAAGEAKLESEKLQQIKAKERELEAKERELKATEQELNRVRRDSLDNSPEALARAARFEIVLRREGVPKTLGSIFRPSLVLMGMGLWLGPLSQYEDEVRLPLPPKACPRLHKFLKMFLGGGDADFLFGFAPDWAEHGFPVVKAGAKQSAAMMLTNPPPGVAAPWPACVITVPDGLVEVGGVPVRHLLCRDNYGSHSIYYVGPSGPIDVESSRAIAPMMANLRGSLFAVLEAGTHVATESYRGRSKHRNRGYREAPPPGTTYVIKAPVNIDLRSTVRDVCSGKRRGGRPTIQFVVRGHWRNQACGPGKNLRKLIWIEPFWKGPRDAVAAIKAYAVKSGATA